MSSLAELLLRSMTIQLCQDGIPARDPRFVTRAIDGEAHRGYQTWHRELDAEIVDWLARNPNATSQQFEGYLKQQYAQPDRATRFPNGF